ACHVLLGVILMFGDGFGALWILGFTGVATLIAGVIFIIGGYSRISKAKQVAAGQVGAADADYVTSDSFDELNTTEDLKAPEDPDDQNRPETKN
ncbi:MAG: HdeD family acid-resistance protein, partial [Brevibacterium aurantiacum]